MPPVIATLLLSLLGFILGFALFSSHARMPIRMLRLDLKTAVSSGLGVGFCCGVFSQSWPVFIGLSIGITVGMLLADVTPDDNPLKLALNLYLNGPRITARRAKSSKHTESLKDAKSDEPQENN